MSRLILALVVGVAFLSPSRQLQAGEKKETGPTVAALLEQLKAADTPTRLKALMALADLGPGATPAVPQLVSLFETKDENLRLNAALALSKIGQPAVAALQKSLEHKDDDVRFYAVWSLGWIGPAAKETAPHVVKLLADPNDNVRRKAAYSLGKIAPEPETAIRALIGAFRDKNAEVRQAAADAVAQFKDDAVPALKEALEIKDATMRVQVLKALETIGPAAKKALPEVQAIFLVGDKATAQAAMSTLAKIGKEAIDVFKEGFKSDRLEIRVLSVEGMGKIGAAAAPDLVDALGHGDVEVRRQAALQLARLRIGDRMVVLGLAHAVADKDRDVLLAALSGLQNLSVAAKEAASRVVPLLAHKDRAVRYQAYSTLSSIRGEARDVLPGLAKVLESKELDREGMTLALNVLSSCGPEAVPELVKFLKHDDANVRLQAANCLGRVTGDLSPYVSDLEKLADDGNKDIRRGAIQAMGRAGAKAFKTLHKALKDEDVQIRIAAVASLRQLGPAAKAALDDLATLATKETNTFLRRNAILALGGLGEAGVPALVKVLNGSKDQQSLVTAMQSLSSLGDKAAPATEALIDQLRSPTPFVRWTAATTLGNIGPAAKAAIPALEAATKDAHPTVRNFATQALAKINIPAK